VWDGRHPRPGERRQCGPRWGDVLVLQRPLPTSVRREPLVLRGTQAEGVRDRVSRRADLYLPHALIAISELRAWIETFHGLRSGKDKTTTWAEFASTLNEHLGHVHPALSVAREGPRQTYRVERLRDALWFELWNQATEGRRLRRCPECRALFCPGRSNQKYCTHLCANRPTVRRWKRAQKRKTRWSWSTKET